MVRSGEKVRTLTPLRPESAVQAILVGLTGVQGSQTGAMGYPFAVKADYRQRMGSVDAWGRSGNPSCFMGQRRRIYDVVSLEEQPGLGVGPSDTR